MSTRRNLIVPRGFSLIELMVALSIGALISSGMIVIYGQAARSFQYDESYSAMQENGHYALQVLSDDLVMADFWGEVIASDTIASTLTTTPLSCESAIGLFTGLNPIQVNNYHASPAQEQFTRCTALTAIHEPQTDILVVKRVSGAPTAEVFIDTADSDGDSNTTEVISSGVSALKSGKVYLRGNGIEASLINNASSESPPPTGEADWAYRPALYFIRQYTDSPGDGIPSLCRYTLSLTTSFGEEECLAEGIEDLHVEFGIDTDSDGYANLYTGEPSTAQMTAAVTARVHVLARTVRPLPHYTNDKVYNLGNVTLAQKSDGLLRRVYTGTVVLRNTVNRSLIN